MARKQMNSEYDVSSRHRSAFKLMTMSGHKTGKGEAMGYLTGILYLQPHTSGGGKTVCPHSTPACREMCLAGAGLSGLPRQVGAKRRRTDMYFNDLLNFQTLLSADVAKLAVIAASEGLTPAVRLNGTSDILWERSWIIDAHPKVTFYDYSKWPLERRIALPPNYHLTYSVGGPEDMLRALTYLEKGHGVAVVVPEDVKHQLVGLEIDLGPAAAVFIDGDEHDLRFLDPPGSIVLLKPKGYIRTDLVRPDILNELRGAVRAMRAA